MGLNAVIFGLGSPEVVEHIRPKRAVKSGA